MNYGEEILENQLPDGTIREEKDCAPHPRHHGDIRPVPGSGLMCASSANAAIGAALLTVALLAGCGSDAQYTQIAAGADHTCGLRSDGSVVCWGSDEHGQLRAPADERFAAISAGGLYTCGLRSDGTPVCWGYVFELDEDWPEVIRAQFLPPFPPEDERFTLISASGFITCGLRAEGVVVCWNARDEYVPFETEQIVQTSAGGAQVCGLRSDGSALCDPFDKLAPPERERFVAISMAASYGCGLRSDDGVLCWGLDTAGQLSPPEDGPFSAIAAGTLHTCALRSDGSAVCWGYDFEGWAGRTSGSVPDPNDRAGKVLLDEEERLRSLPLSGPPEGERFTAITAGALHACGLREDGGISCWGSDEHGQASPPGVD